MNIVVVSDDCREAEFLKQELSKHTPTFRTYISPNTQNALFCFVVPGTCDVILLDASVPDGDAVNLIETIRNEKKPIGVVAMVGASETELPIELYYAGVDRFILKRDGYVALLIEALREAKERHPTEAINNAQRARLFYAGDVGKARSHLSSLPYVTLESLELTPDGILQLPDTAAFPGDLIILDSELTGAQTLKTVKETKLRAPDVPIILLASPEDENTAIEAMQMGAVDCICKTESYIQRLLPAIGREIERLQLIREKAAHRSREDRLRQIVEIMPAGITVIAPDGTFLAVNRNGLKLMGATRNEQIIGKNLVQLVSQEERERVLAFLATISGWASASVCLNWKGPDETVPGIELRAVPMRRESADTAAILAAIYGFTGHSNNQSAIEDDEHKGAQKYELLFRDLQEKYSHQQKLWEEALQQAEFRRLAAEKQQAKLQADVENAAVRFKLLVEEQRAEQMNWKQSSQSLQEQCAKLEKMIQSLLSGQATLVETSNTEQTQWDLECKESRQKPDITEESLAQLSEAFYTERSQWDLVRQQLEQKCQAAEEQTAVLQAALREAQSDFIQLSERHSIELSQRDFAQKKTEQKYQAAEKQRIALQNALEVAESSLTQISEMRAQWNHTKQELEQRCLAAEKQQAAALQNAGHESGSKNLSGISEQSPKSPGLTR